MLNQVITFSKKQLILFGIGIIIMMVIVSTLSTRVDTPISYDPYRSKIDSLNIELKYIKYRQNILDVQIKKYKDSIDISNDKIDSLGKELIKTRIYYGKKIKDIGNYTPSELSNFFTTRYK
jgi:methyl coenzyme M reductase subunit C-like uncharacterized protein (methanogenesis marker protein 7)